MLDASARRSTAIAFVDVNATSSLLLKCAGEWAIERGMSNAALNAADKADGAENEAIWKRLVERQCDAAQGYFISRPMPGADLVGWVGRWHQN